MLLAGLDGGDLLSQLKTVDGLPIVDINEEVADDSHSLGALGEPEIRPLSSISPTEREIRQRERDHILDMLEAEEADVERQERDSAKEQRRKAVEIRREMEKKEVERLTKQKEMQKKMGKALLKSISTEAEVETSTPALIPTVPKKFVSFSADQGQEADWGDIQHARLSSTFKRPTLISQLQSDASIPMKMSVIERTPGAPTLPIPEYIDSDNESEPPASDSDGAQELEEGTDFDYAQHQREIALEYHEKRSKIGLDVATAMTSHDHFSDSENEQVHPFHLYKFTH